MLTFEMFQTIHRSDDDLTIFKATALKNISVFNGYSYLIIEAEENLYVSYDHHSYLTAHWVSLDGKDHYQAPINEPDVKIRKNK